MDQVIEQLLTALDSDNLSFFPCFYDTPFEIQFRLGLNIEGPLITFSPDSSHNYLLFIRDERDRIVNYLITGNDDLFSTCQRVFQRVRGLCADAGYQKARDEDNGMMFTNLINVIRPVIAKAPLTN